MKLLPLAILAAALPASAALARPTPTPPSSGVVIHLFGANSVSSNFLPSLGGGGKTTPASTSTAALSLGGVLHQMFVTGDPSVPPTARLSKGKTGGN